MRIQEASVGQVIRFGRRNGQQTLGAIVAVGVGRRRNKVKVKTMEPRGVRRLRPAGGVWTVTVSMCTLAGPDAVVVVANEPETVTVAGSGVSDEALLYSKLRRHHQRFPWLRALMFAESVRPSNGWWICPIRSGAITGAEADGMVAEGLGTVSRLSASRRVFITNTDGIMYLARAREAL